MRRFGILALPFVGICLFGVPTQVLSSQEEPLKALLQAKYDRLVKAYQTKDAKTLESILAPDYSAGTFSHPLDRQKSIEEMKKASGLFQTRSRKVLQVLINGNKATAVEDSSTIGRFQIAHTNIFHIFEVRQRCADTWVKNPAGWQIKNMRILHTQTLEDGKPLKIKKRH